MVSEIFIQSDGLTIIRSNHSESHLFFSLNQGIRFDCPNGGSNWDHLGRGATIRENVVWNAGNADK